MKKTLKDCNYIRIRSFEADDLYKSYKRNKEWIFEPRKQNFTKKNTDGFNLVLSPSMDRMKLEQIIVNYGEKGEKYYDVVSGQVDNTVADKNEEITIGYLHAIINIRLSDLFSKAVEKEKNNDEKEEIREALLSLYTEGIRIHGIHYVEYKRSANQAKDGKHLFIAKDLYEPMKKWSWMNLEPDGKDGSITEAAAYESLTLSSIKGIVHIDRSSILMVDDLEYEFDAMKTNDPVCAIVEDSDNINRIKVDRLDNEESFMISNSVFDGEGLLDHECFCCDEEFADKGMLLLRNHFFKCCAFHTDIQGFYRDHYGEAYDEAVVYDMFGNELKAKDVRLIITPSSLKFLKFDFLFDGENKLEKAYKHWIDNLEDDFGVVKYDHSSSDKEDHMSYEFKDLPRLSYQMINSLPLTKEDVAELAKKDMDYVDKLKNDDDVFLKSIEKYGVRLTIDFVSYIVNQNRAFLDTEIVRDWRNERIRNTVYDLQRGKVHVCGGNYVICSMPYELLQWSAKPQRETTDEVKNDFKKNTKQCLHREEVYIAGKMEGVKATLFRNPHICASSVAYVSNVCNSCLDKYFFFDGTRILVMSPANWDIMEKLGGADFDSDTVLYTENEVICRAAKAIHDSGRTYPVPHNKIKSSKEIKTISKEALLDVDIKLCKNLIGRTVDLSQVLNSKYWEVYGDANKADQIGCDDQKTTNLKSIYDKILMLDVLSTLEIDKAKHHFEIDTNEIIDELKDEKGEKFKYPLFMYTTAMIRRRNKHNKFDKYNVNKDPICPMDYLVFALRGIKRKERKDIVPVDKLIKLGDYRKSAGYIRTLSERLLYYIERYNRVDNSKEDLEWNDKEILRTQVRQDWEEYYNKSKLEGKITEDVFKYLINVILSKVDMGQKWISDHPFEAVYILFGLSPKAFLKIVVAYESKHSTDQSFLQKYVEIIQSDEDVKAYYIDLSKTQFEKMLRAYVESSEDEEQDKIKKIMHDRLKEIDAGELIDKKGDSCSKQIKKFYEAIIKKKKASSKKIEKIVESRLILNENDEEYECYYNPFSDKVVSISGIEEGVETFKKLFEELIPECEIAYAWVSSDCIMLGRQIQKEEFAARNNSIPNTRMLFNVMMNNIFKVESKQERIKNKLRWNRLRALSFLYAADPELMRKCIVGEDVR